MAAPLHIKYRPNKLDDFKGENNQSIVSSLKDQLNKEFENIPRVYLFIGPSGCGKTTLERIMANELGCSERDRQEYNAANTRGIDTIRDISSNCKMAPFQGKIRVYGIDECHSMTKDAQNALLKLLEDTPSHVFIFLCTTDPNMLLETIKNRCSIYQVSPWETNETYQYLKNIVSLEKGTCSSKTIKRIAEESKGSPRKSLTMLDQVLFMNDDDQAKKLIVNYSDDDTKTIDICRLVLAKNDNSKWNKMKELIKGYTGEPEGLRKAILGYLTNTLLNQGSMNDFANRVQTLIGLFGSKNWQYDGKAAMAEILYESCGI
jgi:DNA polymerase-3 subunit gamma/tau